MLIDEQRSLPALAVTGRGEYITVQALGPQLKLRPDPRGNKPRKSEGSLTRKVRGAVTFGMAAHSSRRWQIRCAQAWCLIAAEAIGTA